MKTVQSWLEEVKGSTEKLHTWLCRQYIGEALAADRIETLAKTPGLGVHESVILSRIAREERLHRDWVGGLLRSRGIPLPVPSYEDTRYWGPILDQELSFSEIAAAGHHAEVMRLLRIRALADDMEIPTDIRLVFASILPDEVFHAKAFAHMSSPESIEKMRGSHELGLQALGLEI